MPTYKQGNMWDCLNQVNHFIITTNAIVKRNGALVMGAGIAKQVRDNNPGIDRTCGDAVKTFADATSYYGCLLSVVKGEHNSLGLFQVKYHFKDQADTALIARSTWGLRNHAERFPQLSYALNFPGIGNGKLAYNDVKPMMDTLPDNVQVWTFS